MTSIARLATPVALASCMSPIAGAVTLPAATKVAGTSREHFERQKRMEGGGSSASFQGGRCVAKILPGIRDPRLDLSKLNDLPLFMQVIDPVHRNINPNLVRGVEEVDKPEGYPLSTHEIAGGRRDETELRETLYGTNVEALRKNEGACIAQVSLMKGKVCKSSGYIAKRSGGCALNAGKTNEQVCYGPVRAGFASCAYNGSAASCYGPLYGRFALCSGRDSAASCYGPMRGIWSAGCAYNGSAASCYGSMYGSQVFCSESDSAATCYRFNSAPSFCANDRSTATCYEGLRDEPGSYDVNHCSVTSTIVLVDFDCSNKTMEPYELEGFDGQEATEVLESWYKPICTGTINGTGEDERCETGENGAVVLPEGLEIARHTIIAESCRTERSSGLSLASIVVITICASVLGALSVGGVAIGLASLVRRRARRSPEEVSPGNNTDSSVDAIDVVYDEIREGMNTVRGRAGNVPSTAGPVYDEVQARENTVRGWAGPRDYEIPLQRAAAHPNIALGPVYSLPGHSEEEGEASTRNFEESDVDVAVPVYGEVPKETNIAAGQIRDDSDVISKQQPAEPCEEHTYAVLEGPDETAI